MDRFSVILTVFNEEKGISRVLKYLESRVPHELTIVSDRCVDKTNLIIEKWAIDQRGFKINFFDRKERFGRADAIRLGLTQSRNDLVVVFSGDIQPFPDSLDNIVRYFKDKRVGAVTGHPILLNGERSVGDCLSQIMWDSHNQVGKNETIRGCFFHLNGEIFAFRKSALMRFKNYNGLAEDAMIGWLIHKNGFRVLWADDVKYYMRYPSSLSEWLKIRKRCCLS